MSNRPDQALRLRVAAEIKAIADHPGDIFEAWRADEIAKLLEPTPLQKSSMAFGFRKQDRTTSGEAAGVGPVSVPGETAERRWSTGERSFRCGAYVIEKFGPTDFTIRHVGDVDADAEDGQLLELKRSAGQWIANLNQPRHLALGPFHVVIGGRFVPWKRGV